MEKMQDTFVLYETKTPKIVYIKFGNTMKAQKKLKGKKQSEERLFTRKVV